MASINQSDVEIKPDGEYISDLMVSLLALPVSQYSAKLHIDKNKKHLKNEQKVGMLLMQKEQIQAE